MRPEPYHRPDRCDHTLRPFRLHLIHSFRVLPDVRRRLSIATALSCVLGAGCADDAFTGPEAPPEVSAEATARAVPVGHFVSASGRSGAAGSSEDPWDLTFALSGRDPSLRPGDTLWVRGGTYRGGFVSDLRGRPGAPIVVRAYPGERVILDGAPTSGSTLQVRGDWTVFWGLELMSSDPNRVTDAKRPNTIYNQASHTKYVNLVVHDGGVAFYSEPQHANVEVYGSIFYNNGWQGSDRGHGHGVYVKSNVGPVLVRDNILFNQFGYGIHVYSNAGAGRMVNIRLEGNVSFNNGTHGTNTSSSNILIGGEDYATDILVASNYTYLSPGVRATNVKIGFGSTANGHVSVLNNDFVGGAKVLDLGYWQAATMTGNFLHGGSALVAMHDDAAGYSWSGNQHGRDPGAAAWSYRGTSYGFDAWRRATRLASGDRASRGQPSRSEILVRRNRYESGRGTIVVYNWSRQGSVPVNLGGVVPVGARYAVRHVQRLHDAPLASGTYNGGAVTLRLDGVSPPRPIGMASSRAPSTGRDFVVFVVTPS